MARQFGSYSPVVPLGITWEESITLEDEDTGAAIDLTGYDVIAQLREDLPVRADGAATTDPVLELTTAGYYASAPAWPVFEAFSVPTPADGTILARLDVADLWTASPDNAKRKLRWAVVLVNGSGYRIPVVNGKVVFLPGDTI